MSHPDYTPAINNLQKALEEFSTNIKKAVVDSLPDLGAIQGTRDQVLWTTLEKLTKEYRRLTGLEGAYDDVLRRAERVLEVTKPENRAVRITERQERSGVTMHRSEHPDSADLERELEGFAREMRNHGMIGANVVLGDDGHAIAHFRYPHGPLNAARVEASVIGGVKP